MLLFICKSVCDIGTATKVQNGSHSHFSFFALLIFRRDDNSSIFNKIRRMWKSKNKITMANKTMVCWITSFSFLIIFLGTGELFSLSDLLADGCLLTYSFSLRNILKFKMASAASGKTAVNKRFVAFTYHKM